MMKIFWLTLLFIYCSTNCFAGNESADSTVHILPEPVSINYKQGTFRLNRSTVIVAAAKQTGSVAALLKELLDRPTGFSIPIKNAVDSKTGNAIIVKLNTTPDIELGDEGYTLDVSSNRVLIAANKPNGIFCGIQTLLQLFPPSIENKTAVTTVKWSIPCLIIRDYPRFKWRGLMLDVSRHFFPKEFIKKYIDQMVKYKLNVFHWHLTDDQGWRIEIEGLPRLTEVGAWRVPRTGRPGRFEPPQPDEEKTYGGYYTQEDIKEIVRYAQERFVTVLPEIDLPGHSIALFASYPGLSCTGIQYPINVGSPYFKGTHEVCVANDSTWLVLDKIFTQVAKLFPGKYIHVGGDEAQKQFWLGHSKDIALMQRENLKSGEELQSYFTKKLSTLISSKGKQIIGWDEIEEGGLAPGAAVMSYRSIGRAELGGTEAARQGHYVVMTPEKYTYLDYVQGDTLVEPISHRTLRLSTCYQFEPVPAGIDPKYILGGQGNLWTENVWNGRHAEYMTWPRSLALAEVFWSPASKRNWPAFIKRMERQFAYMDVAQVKYARSVYDPVITGIMDREAAAKATVENPVKDTTFYPLFKGQFLDPALRVKLATEIPGLDIYYTFDGTNPDNFYPKYDGRPLEIPKGALGDSEIRVVTYRNGKPVGKQINCKLSEVARRIERYAW